MAGKGKKARVVIKGFIKPDEASKKFTRGRSDAVYDDIFLQCSENLGNTLDLEIADGEDPINTKGNIYNAMLTRNLKAGDGKYGKFTISVKLSDDEKSIGVMLSLNEPEAPKA
jgi:hypothetical protein